MFLCVRLLYIAFSMDVRVEKFSPNRMVCVLVHIDVGEVFRMSEGMPSLLPASAVHRGPSL
jgi:hypothetical protein